eukprot:11173701-Lingulodinium_polyedra.AAC.1
MSNRLPAAAAARKPHDRARRANIMLVFAWCARGVRFASRCGGRRSFRPHHGAPFLKRSAG